MTSKLTRERIEWLNYAATGLAANGTEMAMSPQDVIALTECCLAAMDSEPVVFTDERNLHHIVMGRETSLIWGKQNSEAGDVPLYRHAQQPVVPDEKPMPNPLSMYAVDAVEAIAEVKGWNTCRAAMLQAGNSPVIGIDPASGPDRTVEVRYVSPPGYVMVPKEPTPEMLEVINEAIKSMRGSAATYARVLAAAPQEVKP